MRPAISTSSTDGDTFRWKGENVATSEVSEAICRFPNQGRQRYGVAIPARTAARHGYHRGRRYARSGQLPDTTLTERLPDYARPVFLRVRDQLDVTSTFKHTKNALHAMATTRLPSATRVLSRPRTPGVRALDRRSYDRIQRGEVRA
jgi:fatty-acyl-CoA synthase